ncbi:MAG: hypothetical protein BGO81_13215 [Devosia sp. 66-22]|nr:MAG: hypothetical protein BGO81_13215 [Devosia sp. 66-22]
MVCVSGLVVQAKRERSPRVPSAGIFALTTSAQHYLPIFAIGSWMAWGGKAVMALVWWPERRATSR